MLSAVNDESFLFAASNFEGSLGLTQHAFSRGTRMHDMLCFAAQNMSRKMDGEGLPRDGFETAPVMVRSCSDRPRVGTDSSGFIFTASTHSVFEASLARKLRFDIQLSVFEGSFKLKQQGCGNEFSLISRFLLPFIFLLNLFLQRYKGFKLVLFSAWCRDVPRSGFGADFGPEKTETI
jgi:hypothetical protein